MSDRMTPEHALCKQGLLVATSRIAEITRQRDAAVEALKRVLARWDEGNKVEWCKSVREDASSVLREIEGVDNAPEIFPGTMNVLNSLGVRK